MDMKMTLLGSYDPDETLEQRQTITVSQTVEHYEWIELGGRMHTLDGQVQRTPTLSDYERQ